MVEFRRRARRPWRRGIKLQQPALNRLNRVLELVQPVEDKRKRRVPATQGIHS